MSPKRVMLNKVESDILGSSSFSTKYELSTLIYSNKNFCLYTVIDKCTKKKYFLEVYKNKDNSSADYIDQWQTQEFSYIIKD